MYLKNELMQDQKYHSHDMIQLVLHVCQHSIEMLQKDVNMMFLKHESGSETNTAGSTRTSMDATLTEMVYHFVSGSHAWQINRTEGSQPAGIAEVSRVLCLQVKLKYF